MNIFITLYENLEQYVKNNYKKQVSGTILNIFDNNRRLDNDIEIENIQNEINIIDYKMKNITLNLFNSESFIDLKAQINRIANSINNQLITLDNTLETYINFASFYLTSENLTPYRTNSTKIYKIVENILNEYLTNQSNRFDTVISILEGYAITLDNDVKPRLIQAINNVLKLGSKQLINTYLNNSSAKGENKDYFEKTTNLTNLNGLSTVLGTTRLNFSTSIQNTILKWGYNMKIDPDNYKVYLDIYGGGYADGYLVYHNEYFNASVAGAFANGKIGLNLTNYFDLGLVKVDYYTLYQNKSMTKSLYELTTLDSWDNCKDAVECFVGQNDDFCPYNVIVNAGADITIIDKPVDIGYYKNSSVYSFTGYYENKLCTYANYFYGVEETSYEYNSTLSITI
jgi:hypothetical protein